MSHFQARALTAHLYVLGLRSPDPQRLADFYGERLGMIVDRRGEAVLAQAAGRRLCFVPGKAKSMEFAAYAVESTGELDHLLTRIERDGAERAEFVDAFGLYDGESVAVRDPDGNLVVFGIPTQSSRDVGAFKLQARLQHCVVASREAQRIRDFYHTTLGFKISDNVEDEEGGLRAAFLRSDNEHHSFAVFRAPDDRFDHHCYEVADWNAIRDWGDHFASFEMPMAWGPGRHGPGNNLFFFIHDPDGNWLEFSAELEVVADDKPTGVWPHSQRTLNSWGSAPLRS